ncbi:MAG: four helix bundle protein [Prevotellaceae bacterium]|jgi:four helix bundle protein|nr:four helix bundle protein [Prevotellaceae bacterium]
MKIKRFEDIIAWQKAQDLAVDIYNNFGKLRDLGFKDQICRAVVSISNNIAEGFDRCSNADFSRFLYIAISSSSEVKSMLYLAERLNFTGSEQKIILLDKTDELAKVTGGFIKSLQK